MTCTCPYEFGSAACISYHEERLSTGLGPKEIDTSDFRMPVLPIKPAYKEKEEWFREYD